MKASGMSNKKLAHEHAKALRREKKQTRRVARRQATVHMMEARS
jgi:hypothetical protein